MVVSRGFAPRPSASPAEWGFDPLRRWELEERTEKRPTRRASSIDLELAAAIGSPIYEIDGVLPDPRTGRGVRFRRIYLSAGVVLDPIPRGRADDPNRERVCRENGYVRIALASDVVWNRETIQGLLRAARQERAA